MRRTLHTCVFLLIIYISGIVHGQGIQKFANLGDFPLENGQVIRECKLGYRTFGTLDEEKSNAILIPTWFTGKTKDFIDSSLIGPGRMFDDSYFYLIAVDAFGNGVSSSPSNSTAQPRDSFPEFSITDMVNAQYTLLTEKLNLTHLNTVMGISMGGMQTFQWMVSYPDFMDKAIPIVGTPNLTTYDLLLWTTELSVIETVYDEPQDNEEAMKIISGIHSLALTTPKNVNNQTKPEDFPKFRTHYESNMSRFNALDFAWQLKAMLAHDVSRPYGGSPDKVVSTIKAQTLIIVSQEDHMVNPEPARELAGLIGADTLEITNDYGHMGVIIEAEKIGAAIARFLNQK